MAAKKRSETPAAPSATAGTTADSKRDALHHPPVEPATPLHAIADGALDASYDGAFDVIAQTPEDKVEALIQAWVAHRNAAAVAAVAHREDAPALARKAARRAMNVLRSRGVAVPERPAVVAALTKPQFTLEARAMFPDGRGAQIWWIAKIANTGGTDVIEVTTVDRQGIVNVNRGNPSAGNLRQLWQGWIARAGRAPSVVPVEYARKKIAEARAASLSRKAVLPMGLDAARDLLGDVTGPVPHPLDGEDLAIPTDEAVVKARLDLSMHLHEEPEFASWMPDDPAGVALLQSINDRVQTLGILPGSQPDEEQQKQIDATVNDAIDEAANAYFDDDKKKVYEARLRDAAWSLYQAGLLERATDALLVSAAIQRAGVISDRPSEIPFVRGMFVKLIAVAQQRAAAMAPTGTEEAERLQA
jgi:hypothetical protein